MFNDKVLPSNKLYCRKCHGTGCLYNTYPKPYDIVEPCSSCKSLGIQVNALLKFWNIEPNEENIKAYYSKRQRLIDYNYNRAAVIRNNMNLPPL